MLIGIDIGGTKISITLASLHGEILSSKRLKTADYSTGEDAVEAIKQTIAKITQKDAIQAIGISSAGPLSIKKGVILSPPNLPSWKNVEIVKLLHNAFKVPVYLNNDANAQALTEYHFGRSKGTANLIYLTASTGMGGGIIVDHKLLVGPTDTAGEVGHFVLDINGPKCPCGQRGCFEIYCGGMNFIEQIKNELKEKEINTALRDIAPLDELNFTHFTSVLKKGDEFASKHFEVFIERLAQGIGILLMSFNPEVIILGTIAYHMQDHLLKPLEKALRRYAWKMPIEACRIETSLIADQISELSGISVALDQIGSS